MLTLKLNLSADVDASIRALNQMNEAAYNVPQGENLRQSEKGRRTSLSG
jgi:hypothetical protein